MRHAYPILLDVSERLAVIVGGGLVAARKARGLVDAGGREIRVVAPQFSGEFPTGVQRIAERYQPSHLDGAGIVFAATDSPEVNDAVVRDARARNILVSRADADDDQPGDFTVPAKLQQGGVIVAVSAASAALSVLIRDVIAARWDARWTQMAEAMTSLRPMVRAAPLEPAQRRLVFRDLASEPALDELSRGGVDALRQWLSRRYPELK